MVFAVTYPDVGPAMCDAVNGVTRNRYVVFGLRPCIVIVGAPVVPTFVDWPSLYTLYASAPATGFHDRMTTVSVTD